MSNPLLMRSVHAAESLLLYDTDRVPWMQLASLTRAAMVHAENVSAHHRLSMTRPLVAPHDLRLAKAAEAASAVVLGEILAEVSPMVDDA